MKISKNSKGIGWEKENSNINIDGENIDLTSYAKKTDLPTKTSQLTNDSGFITEHQDISGKADKSDIPTKTSQLNNDSGYLTSVPSEYVTETELNEKGYLTEHQNISGKADKSYVDTELTKKSDKTHAHSYNDLSDKPVIPSVDGLATKKELTDGLAAKANTNHTHDQYLTEHQDLSNYALKTEIPSVPTKTSQLTNDSGFITSIPSEYVTESELNAKGYLTEVPSEYITETELNTKGYLTSVPSEYITETELNAKGLATETFVTNKIAEASLSGGEVDLSGYATKDELNSTIQDYTGGKKQIYLTQAEYDILTDTEKNDTTKVYNITDATEQVIPTDLTINSNNLLQLKDANGNAIGTGVTVSTTSGETSYTLPTASSTVLGGIKVGDRLSIDSNGVLSADIQQGSSSGTVDGVILTSPGGYKFKLIVNDEGALSTEEIVTYGNIIASVSELSINEGESKTFTISLSQVPTRPQTITISSNSPNVTVNPSEIDISDINPHTITVTASEDDDYDNDTAILTLSSANVPSVTVNVTVVDNDVEPQDTTYMLDVLEKSTSVIADNDKKTFTINNTENSYDLIAFGDTQDRLIVNNSYNMCFKLLEKTVDALEVGANWYITKDVNIFKSFANAPIGEIVKVPFTLHDKPNSNTARLIYFQFSNTITGTKHIKFEVWVEEQ